MTTESNQDRWWLDTTLPPKPTPAERAERDADLVWWATWLGLVLAGVAAVAGVTMAARRKVVECADGSDYECFAHPQAAPGVAIASLAVVLAILVVFASITARAALRRAAD